MKSAKIHISGIVQGVGFRPFLHNLAVKHHITGWVKNSTAGVEIEAQGEEVDLFVDTIRSNPPALAQVEKLSLCWVETDERYSDFRIIQSSVYEPRSALILPDIATCDDCLAELYDRSNHRYRYPLISCTNCGARYSIVRSLPFDRQNCSINTIKMCDKCMNDYLDPANKRYHAQAISCDECGLITTLYDNSQKAIATKAGAICYLARVIADGKVVAIKSTGGFHIVCDATNDEAIGRVREFKQRATKPLAVMFRDLYAIKECAEVSSAEEVMLSSKEAPIVLLRKKPASKLSDLVAPTSKRIGSFLPNSAIYHLLLDELTSPIVATSANLKSDPIIISKEEVFARLGGFVDFVLDYNREIVGSCDDSIVLVAGDKPIKLRTARGYAPVQLSVDRSDSKRVIALGANQKSTFSLAVEDKIVTSPYQGDLNSVASIERYKSSVERFLELYGVEPDLIVCDKHSGYESKKIAYELHKKFNYSTILELQHHYAHMLAVMAEYKIHKPCLAFIFDGTGLGDDGNIWGGEVFVGDSHRYERVFHIKYFRLLGGEVAIKEPRRVALALLFEAFGLDEVLSLPLDCVRSFGENVVCQLYTMWKNGLNSPKTSSAGRLFDGICSLVGGVQKLEYEAQAAQILEELYDESVANSYSYEICGDEIDLVPMVREIITARESERVVASRFINTIIDIVFSISIKYYDMPIILSGGVFQNSVVVAKLMEKLGKANKTVYVPSKYSPNDEAISVGQAYYAIGNI